MVDFILQCLAVLGLVMVTAIVALFVYLLYLVCAGKDLS